MTEYGMVYETREQASMGLIFWLADKRGELEASIEVKELKDVLGGPSKWAWYARIE